MKNIFCVTSYQAVGCTFIDWSVYFLSGQAQHYNVKSKSWLPVSSNPVTDLNAHGHCKNHPHGFAETQHFIEQFKLLNTDMLLSVYPDMLRVGAAAECLNLPPDCLSQPDVLARLVQFRKNNYNKMFKLFEQQQIKTVFVASDPGAVLYFNKRRVTPTLISDYNKVADNIQHAQQDFQEIFFNQSLTQWNNLGLNNIWDVRERMALDSRPFDFLDSEFIPPATCPHLWINSMDLWTRTPGVIKKIMNYLELPIDQPRFDQWLLVCQAWQKIQLDILEFCYNQKHIVDAIVNNWHYDIDLTFEQEVIIQHCLIYQHGLNLKTWQLKKFPNNTKDLHKLLETNTHLISN